MPSVRNSILVVDDEPAQRQFQSAVLSKDYEVVTAADVQEARRMIERRNFDLIITDERMPRISGTELIKWVKEQLPEMPIIVLTAYGSVETAVEAVKMGADDYLIKPLKSPDELRRAVEKALKERVLRDRGLILKAESEAEFPQGIIAESQAMKQVIDFAKKVAPQSTTVLLTGESGTGKEIVARFIHRQSARADGPFVAINCAALTETLLESELFGHEKGAFTGATQVKRGLFELAHAGTLFLDEIGEMSINLQAKLLRVLEERQFERVGGIRAIKVDVRLIAATNKELERAIEEKSFREDLYYRLNVFAIHIPPLRERREDIPPLAGHFLRKISSRMGCPPKSICERAQRILMYYEWPGNVRELQNAIERALIVSQSDSICSGDLPVHFLRAEQDKHHAITNPVRLAEIEKAAILDALANNGGNRQATAEQLGISLRTLQYRLKEYGLAGRE
jgi:DNA-binding NtrC family response regulator